MTATDRDVRRASRNHCEVHRPAQRPYLDRIERVP